MIEVPSKEDIENLREHHMELSGRFAQMLKLFEETTSAVGKLQDELQEMPGGYRNSQDIKFLKGRIEKVEFLKSRVDELEKKLQPGGVVTVHSKLADLEESVKLLATEMANANKKISELESGCGNARYSVCSKKLDTLEECCKNTVAAGKVVERRIDFLESSSRNLSSRLDAHGANIKIMGVEISRFQKFMDKLHEL